MMTNEPQGPIPSLPPAEGQHLEDMRTVAALLQADHPREVVLEVAQRLRDAAISRCETRELAETLMEGLAQLADTLIRPENRRLLRLCERAAPHDSPHVIAWAQARAERHGRSTPPSVPHRRQSGRFSELSATQSERGHLACELGELGAAKRLEQLRPHYPQYAAAFATCLAVARGLHGPFDDDDAEGVWSDL